MMKYDDKQSCNSNAEIKKHKIWDLRPDKSYMQKLYRKQ